MNLLEAINAEIAEMNKRQSMGNKFEEELLAKLPPKALKKRGRPPKVSKEIFADIWRKCVEDGNLKEVAQRLGISPACAAVKASNMRKEGYDLPQFKRGRPRKDNE
jgi:hypothetical protein